MKHPKYQKAVRYSFCVGFNPSAFTRDEGEGVYLTATYCNNRLSWKESYGEFGHGESLVIELNNKQAQERHSEFYCAVNDAIKNHSRGEEWPVLKVEKYWVIEIAPEIIRRKI